jgi:hypothetical protein
MRALRWFYYEKLRDVVIDVLHQCIINSDPSAIASLWLENAG